MLAHVSLVTQAQVRFPLYLGYLMNLTTNEPLQKIDDKKTAQGGETLLSN
jgi:hypothetical protein